MHIAFRHRPLAFGTLVATCLGAPLAAGVLVGLVGCAHFQPPAAAEAPETVGALAPSYHSVAVAPIHATTDFGHAEIVETGNVGPDAASPAELVVATGAGRVDASPPSAEMASAPVARGGEASPPPAASETPEVVAKSAHGF
jgi:hypothetical protein